MLLTVLSVFPITSYSAAGFALVRANSVITFTSRLRGTGKPTLGCMGPRGVNSALQMDLRLMQDADEPARQQKTGTQLWYARVARSYKEGYERSRARFQERRGPTAAAGPLRPQDRVLGVVLALTLVELAAFGVALAGSWLVLGAPPAEALQTAGPQARLRAAFGAAASLRASTRLPRLLTEVCATPFVLASLARSPQNERFGVCQERATQALAVFAALVLTLRALNVSLLGGATGPALAVLSSGLGQLLAPLLASLPAVAPMAAAVASVAHATCSGLAAAGHALVSLEVASRRLLPLKPLFYVAELERHLAAPFVFVCVCLRAFYQEALLTGLRRLGLVAMRLMA